VKGYAEAWCQPITCVGEEMYQNIDSSDKGHKLEVLKVGLKKHGINNNN
jgi:hypothetical protein